VYEQAVRHNGWTKVIYLGELSRSEVLQHYSDTAIGLILYNNVGQYFLSYAVKLFEYMNYNIPVIMPNFGEWSKFNKENKCGICVNVNDSRGVARTIDALLQNEIEITKLGFNGRKAIEKKYNWKVAEKKLIDLYKKLEA
jgi:glycosyltransferase involved in cell wall biosynthesis